MNKETTLSKDGWDKLTEVLSSVNTPTPEMIALFSEDNPRFMEAVENYNKTADD